MPPPRMSPPACASGAGVYSAYNVTAWEERGLGAMIASEPRDPTFGTWWVHAYHHGLDCVRTMLQQLERDAANLTIDPVVWENSTAALEWMAEELASGRMRGQQVVTPEDVERVRRLRALGREALAGGPPSPELPPLIKQTLNAVYGPDWDLIPDWDTSLAASREAAQAASVPGHDPDEAMDRLEWLAATLMCGGGYIYGLARAIERGDAHLPVGPLAWENAMAALERAVLEHVRGRVQWTREILTLEDVERVRRLRALGAEALSGGSRSQDIGSLAQACLGMLFGPDWERSMPDVEAAAQAIVHGYPPS